MLRRLAAALGLCGLCAVTACSLLVDTDGLSTAGADAASNDGATLSMPPSGEAGSDAAGTDGATGDSASASSFCATAASTHAFCDDFDTGDSNLATRWDELKTTAGPVDLDTTRVKSAPRALRTSLMPTMGTQDSHLGKLLDVQNGSVRVELDMFVATPSGTFTEVDPISFLLTPTPTGYDYHGLYLFIRPGSIQLQYFASKSSGNLDNEAPVPLTMDAWHHVVMTFSYSSMPPRGTISIDGGNVASVAMAGPAPTKLDLQLGAAYASKANVTWSLSFDNVAVDTP